MDGPHLHWVHDMHSIRNPTCGQFAEYLEWFPASLGRWRYPGEGGASVAIGGVDYRAALLDITDMPAGLSVHQNAAGILASWMLGYMDLPPGPKASPSDNEQAWSTAVEYWTLSNHVVEVEDGRRGYESRGRHVYLSYNGDPNLYALGRWLELAERAGGSTGQELSNMRRTSHEAGMHLGAWFEATGGTRTWFCTPDDVRDPLREAAQSLLAVAPMSLPPETPALIGGSLGAIAAYWCELLALGLYNHRLLQRSFPIPLDDGAETQLAVPLSLALGTAAFPRQLFAEYMAAASDIAKESANEITDHLTQDAQRARDPALTPLIHLDDERLFPMSSLIVPASPHRNILKILQAAPKSYGGLGDLLGAVGEQIVRQLLEERVAEGVRVAMNVPVRYRQGWDATDLDVVVHSPHEHLLVVLEVKWRLPVDGTYESRHAENDARHKRDARERHRAEIRSRVTGLSLGHHAGAAVELVYQRSDIVERYRGLMATSASYPNRSRFRRFHSRQPLFCFNSVSHYARVFTSSATSTNTCDVSNEL